MLICLHLGAHKTASTYMQSKLMEDREKLAEANIGVVFHNFFRKQISSALDAVGAFGGVGLAFAKPALTSALAKMITFHSGRSRVIMSDENLAGPILSAIGEAGLYPDVKRRLGVVLDCMPAGHETKVFFAVRGYAEFYSSIYAYRAGQRQTQDIELFRQRALNLKRGWADVVTDICSAAGPERTVVWTYEHFAKHAPSVNNAVLGDWKPKVFVKSDKSSLPSLSRKGLVVLDRLSEMLSETEHAGLARVVARFNFDPPDEKFSLFDVGETKLLTERYDRDLDAIARLGCEIVKPAPRPSNLPAAEAS